MTRNNTATGPGLCRCMAFIVAVLAAFPASQLHAADLEPGIVLGPENAQLAEGLIPPEFLARYKSGEWRHAVAVPKPGTNLMDPDWLAAGAENEGKFIVNGEGSIREISSGKLPAFIWGPPFPKIDPSDPGAAAKIGWNFFYQSYILGDDENLVSLIWIGHGGVDRELKTNVIQKFWDGQKPHRIPAENPLNLLSQQFVQVTYPADVQGTVALSWRYRDVRRDSNWAYVPALRRVREVSPTNRSDGAFGSDQGQDDGSYFDGKPEDFTWKLAGQGEELFLLDKGAVVEGKEDIRPLPKGGWRAVYPSTPRFNYELASAKTDRTLLPWAPVGDRFVLVRRPVWIVELTPKDKYYLYGKVVLRFDKETWYGCYASKYDWQGNVLNSYLPLHGAWFKKGDDYRPYSAGEFQLSQNWKLDRATVSRSYADDPSVAADSLIPIAGDQFDVGALAKSGR